MLAAGDQPPTATDKSSTTTSNTQNTEAVVQQPEQASSQTSTSPSQNSQNPRSAKTAPANTVVKDEPFAKSQEFKLFKSWVALQKVFRNLCKNEY